MKSLGTILSAALLATLFASPAMAQVIQFDFNDLSAGQLSGQAGGSGVGGSLWQNNEMTTLHDVVGGDLTAPASTNFALTQSGTPQSVEGTGAGFGTGRIARVLDTPLTGTVWFSFLAQYDDTSSRVGLGFNGTSDTATEPRLLTLSSGTLRFDGAGANIDVGGVFTDGASNLLLGRIDIDDSGSDDRIRLWSNPDVSGGLGTPLFDDLNDTFGSSLTSIGVLSYGANSGAVDLITLSNGPNAFMDVTGLPPVLAAEWVSLGSGSWGTGSNWDTDSPPDGLEAIFGSAIAGPTTVTLDQDRLVTGVTFNSSNSYTLTAQTLSVSENVSTFQGSHTIVSSLELAGGTQTFASSAGANLDVTGSVLTASDAAATIVLDGAGGGSLGAIRDNNDVGNSLDGTDNVAVVKRGSGTWTIGAGNTTQEDFHGGDTTVEAGTLKVRSNTPGGTQGELRSPVVTVQAGATLDTSEFSSYSLGVGQSLKGGGTIDTGTGALQVFSDNRVTVGDGVGSMTVDGDLRLNGVEGSSPSAGFEFELSDSTSTGNDQVVVTGDLVADFGSGDTGIIIQPTGTSLASGSYELFKYTGSLSGGASDFSIDATTRYSLNVTTDSDSVNLEVSGSNANLTWRGDNAGAPTAWDLDSTANWDNGGATDVFFDLDNVEFDDSAVGTTVEVQGEVKPAAANVTAATKDFTFAGAGAIAGSAALNKSGAARLTISNANTYTGTTNITGGVLHADNNAALGSTAGQTVVNGGTLDITGSNIAGETVHIQGAGSDGRGALLTDGFDSVGGGGQQISNVVQDGDATIGAYFDGVEDQFAGNDYRWDLEPSSAVPSASWAGNGHDLTKKGRGIASLSDVGEMNVANINVEEGNLLLQGTSTSTGASVTVGAGTPLQDDFTGNAALSFFYSSNTGLPPSGGTQTMDVTLNGGAFNATGAATVPVFTLNGSIQNNNVSGDAQIDNELTVEVDQTFVVTQAITGSGDLRLGGGGVIELQANNTYSGRTQVTGNLALTGAGRLSNSSSIEVGGNDFVPSSIDVSGRTDGSLNLDNQSLSVGKLGTITGHVTTAGASSISLASSDALNGNVTISSGSMLVGRQSADGLEAGEVTGNVLIESGGTLQVDTGLGSEQLTNVFVQTAGTIGSGFNYVAFEAESFTTYNDASNFGWDVQPAQDGSGANPLGGNAIVAVGGGSTVAGNDDTAQYDMVFSEPGTYNWYARIAAPGGTSADSFFGPDQNADTANPSVAPGTTNGSQSRFGIASELKDAEGSGGISTDWDWLRSDPSASSLVSFEQVTVTQADVDNGTIFSIAFEPRQSGAQLDKMVLVTTPAFTSLTDTDLDNVAENSVNEVVAVPAPFLTFQVNGDLTLNDGSTLEIDLRADDDFDNLSVTGNAAIDGMLSVNLDGFTPDVNDTFTIMTAGLLTDNGLALGGPNGSAFSLSTLNDMITLTFTGLTSLAGDYNGDNVVDAADYTAWRDNVGQPDGTLPNDGALTGDVGSAHYDLWEANYGATLAASASSDNSAVPEPGALLLLLCGLAAGCGLARRR